MTSNSVVSDQLQRLFYLLTDLSPSIPVYLKDIDKTWAEALFKLIESKK